VKSRSALIFRSFVQSNRSALPDFAQARQNRRLLDYTRYKKFLLERGPLASTFQSNLSQ